MSSHHIVREKQEPALFITHLDEFDGEHLGQLLEWSPSVIVTEELYTAADSLGIKIDAVASVDPDFQRQENTKLILTGTDPLSDVLKHLVAEQYPAVNIIASQFVLKDYVLFVDDIDFVVFTAKQRIFPVHSGFSKWQPQGELVEILYEVAGLKLSGLIPEGAHVYKTEKDGFYTLTFDQPFTFIAENY